MTRKPSLESLDLDSPLWQFALIFWRVPKAESLCLALQAKGWSVTRILCAIWLTTLGKTYKDESEGVCHWRRTMTLPLRSMRQAVPKGVAALSELRQQLAASELEAERVELALAFNALNRENEVSVPSQDVADTLFRCNLYAAAPDAQAIDQEARRLINSLTELLADHFITPVERQL
ncbi:MAG: DUF2390 domain-containing protein [Marinobacter sp.]|uniref:DUF2390 domain-containing protein n=1 Tax=Marinobacter sp. TaxID=50741 RepID=UPI0034A07279